MTQRRSESVSGLTGRAFADGRGAAFVEFLIAFFPVYVFFLCLIQLALLFSARLITEHAAVNAARAAAVVIGDDPALYSREKAHELPASRGDRYTAIRNATVLSLAPLILNGTALAANVEFPPAEQPGGVIQRRPIRFEPMTDQSITKLRVRVEVQVACRIGLANRIACPLLEQVTRPTSLATLSVPSLALRAEAVFPYQGARYEYRNAP